ncbi:hypothetical protein ThrDRAFT_00419 [Frankia casuarinae]|uniref:Acyl-CoA carboxylase subunit epsilon n=1 Tax=Frankia casuarinae (strain DSM 45818 / CECT 9043 / HFP020203 / CcI3) TaxID=106370 RepID=Q2JF59_FRACC|nr:MULTISPECIES: acyl-CoA carboxylase subunit epsilon [Frankia]ABD10083.1 hypothetical protein Francci3_0699 [Frankia casuarinae]ETA04107.1 hypothetical protein CcI6DRAFT_00322 [Frankia sp. CcI6]EYT94048.1 hypothetical protein ThrDRAFT_00419 [Frankia casuarinae]KDA44673.1 hypothetical protein BMG523Draft_00523 [Frankia sp. BMG5.23]OAA28409.1 Acyl-CoA carboxylase epsilon subunit [Frankia casuarinae]
MVQDDDRRASQPRLQLIRGEATPEEIAAVVALLTARAVPSSAPATRRSSWASPTLALRGSLTTGPGAWQRSGMTPGARTRADW